LLRGEADSSASDGATSAHERGEPHRTSTTSTSEPSPVRFCKNPLRRWGSTPVRPADNAWRSLTPSLLSMSGRPRSGEHLCVARQTEARSTSGHVDDLIGQHGRLRRQQVRWTRLIGPDRLQTFPDRPAEARSAGRGCRWADQGDCHSDMVARHQGVHDRRTSKRAGLRKATLLRWTGCRNRSGRPREPQPAGLAYAGAGPIPEAGGSRVCGLQG